MTTTSDRPSRWEPVAAGPGASTETGRAGGGIDRLNAFDGLFLRGEHLDLVQNYARNLALAIGEAGGPGPVRGLDVRIEGEGRTSLVVDPGLAISPQGRPLLSSETVRLDLSGLDESGVAWWVELHPAEWKHTDAPVTGTLCDDPCGDGTSDKLHQSEGVQVRFRPFPVPLLPTITDPRQRRPWLASHLFAQEDKELRWRTRPPGENDDLTLLGRLWNPADADRNPWVRLGVLLTRNPTNATAGFDCDVWAARRDRSGTAPPARAWEWRLGMRPWDVFQAQILQFQRLFTERLKSRGVADEMAVVFAELEEIRKLLGTSMTKRHVSSRLEELQARHRGGSATGTPPATGPPVPPSVAPATPPPLTGPVTTAPSLAGLTLAELGFADLPPAGYLYVAATGDAGIRKVLRTLLGSTAELPLVHCRTTDVGEAFREAQHRERIRLADVGKNPSPIQVLIPDLDPPAWAGDWVAFVRPDTRVAPPPPVVKPPTEEVDVYLAVETDAEKYRQVVAELAKGVVPTTPAGGTMTPIGTLTFPAGAWTLPPDTHYPAIFADVQKAMSGESQCTALVTATERTPLGYLRARLLAGPFSGGMGSSVDAAVQVADGREAIVVVTGPADVD